MAQVLYPNLPPISSVNKRKKATRVAFRVVTVAIVLLIAFFPVAMPTAGIVVSSIVGTMTLAWITRKFLRARSSPSARTQSAAPAMQADTVVMSEIHIDTPKIERFFEDMANEMPVRFWPQDLARFTQDYATRLGSGAFGVVYKGEFTNGVQVAVKVLTTNLDKVAEEQFMAEVRTIGRMDHVNLLRLRGFCFDTTKKALVYEYMENGSLDRYLFDQQSSSSALPWGKLQEIAVGTAKGLAYLHDECQQRIIHYDIKPHNILLDGGFSPKVADFGLARLCDRAATHVTVTGIRGTFGYAAPELWFPQPVTHKCDVYSFGMLLFEVLGRRRNFEENQPVSQCLPRSVWENFEKGLLEGAMLPQLGVEEGDREEAARMAKVALWCVQYVPSDRPEMREVVKMLEGEVEVRAPLIPFGPLAAVFGIPREEITSASRETSTSRETATPDESSSRN